MTDRIPPQVSLRALREALGLTLDQLAHGIRAQGVEITKFGLSNIEVGRKRASQQLITAWACALGIKPMHVRQGRELREWLDACDADAAAERESESVSSAA